MIQRRCVWSILILSSIVQIGYAQSISLEPGSPTPSTFNVTEITEAGVGPNSVVNNSQTVVYTYPASHGKANIQASISSGIIPTGVRISLLAQDETSKLTGNPQNWAGSSAGLIYLSIIPQNILTTIYTNKTVRRILTYTVEVLDVAQLHVGQYNISVLYTLTTQF